MNPSKSVFIYGLIDPRNNQLRYIGKSIDPPKRLKDHIKESKGSRRNNHNYNWIRQLLAEGLRPVLEILEEIPEDDWREREMDWISAARIVGLELTNRTDGGEGVSSYTNRGRTISDEHRENLSKALKGRVFTEEQKRNMSKNRRGKGRGNKNALGYKHTEETKQRVSATLKAREQPTYWKGKTFSEEHRRKIGEGVKGRVKSVEERRKLSDSLRGRKFSEEHRRNISIGAREREARKRANRENRDNA